MKKFIKRLLGKKEFNSLDYWEKRYAAGGNSGDGSYGRLSNFKAAFINKFIEEKNINSAVEMGCGDGHQLSIINYPKFTGLDVSATVIAQCRAKFSSDSSKRFEVYNPAMFQANESLQADLALSLDVLYHIVEEPTYLQYLKDLFSLGKRYVVVYSTDFYLEETQHVLHRKFTDDVAKLCPEWRLAEHIKNPYPGDGEQESMADFFVFEKK